MKTSKNKIKSLMLALVLSVAAISAASARVCFLPDSTDCGSSDVDIPDVPCKYSSCPTYNSKYQTCYTERIYNNGGTLVECKQVKCNISKSECEAQEANANNSQCCNFDSTSGCYYMGPCPTLCNRDIFDSEKDLGDGYKCNPCKDKRGTFYNCTPINKECSDINSNYSTSCSDSQIAHEVQGVKDSEGNQCYTCESKPVEPDTCVNIAANYDLSEDDGITKPYPAIDASVTYGKLLSNATYGCGSSIVRTGRLNTYGLNTSTIKYGVIDGTDYATINPVYIKDIEYWVYQDGNWYFEHDGYCYSGLCGKEYFYEQKNAYLLQNKVALNELGLLSETKGYCCSSNPGMVKDFKQCVATPELVKHHKAFYTCKEGGLKDNKCYETSYSCDDGYNLVGDKCILPEATCPDGYAFNKAKSTNTSYVCSKINYYCEDNDKYILSGDKCLCKNNGKIYTIWVDDQETSEQQHEIQWLKAIKRTISTNSQADVDVVSEAQVTHEKCDIDSTSNALKCKYIASGPIGMLGPDFMKLSKTMSGFYSYLNAKYEDGSGYLTNVNWKKFSVSINGKSYPVNGVYSQCAETAVVDDNGDIYQVKCGKTKTCHDINPNYYAVSDTKKYDECDGLDSDVYDLRTLDVYGSDGQCFTCYHRTCKEIGEYLEDYEPWYTSCKGYDVKVKTYYGPGSDGECYICRNYKDMLCKDIDSKYIGAKASCTDEEYYKKTIVNSVVGKDGQCYTCNLRTCNDIDADWYNEDDPCPSDGYYYEKKTLRGKKGSDGQCYECEQLFTDIVFLLEQDAVDDLSCEDGYDRSNPFAISKRKVKWSSHLNIENGSYSDINSKTYTLPFDMKIVIKYKVPGVNCSTGDLFFDQKLEMGDPALVPRTVEIVIPAGSNLNYSNNDIEVEGYAGENIVNGQKTIMSIDYYIGDKKTKDLYIGNIHYGFSISSE